eukprot:2635661-Prymnesium_polylepis.1
MRARAVRVRVCAPAGGRSVSGSALHTCVLAHARRARAVDEPETRAVWRDTASRGASPPRPRPPRRREMPCAADAIQQIK